MENEELLFEKEKELVIARLEAVFPEYCFASGNDKKSFSRDEIIQEIKKNSDIGREYIKIEMTFLRALKDGSLINRLNEVVA